MLDYVHVINFLLLLLIIIINKAASDMLIQTQCAAVLVHTWHQASDDSLDTDQTHASTHTHIPYDVKILISARH